MFKKITFKNGLRLITVPQKNTQSATVLVLVGTGSKYEEKRLNGISHFLEHLLFKGTKKRPTPQKVAETLDRLGGIYNAFTSEEDTGYFAKVKSTYFEEAVDWVSDIYLNSILPPEEIERERGVIIEEINMYHDNPLTHIWTLWKKLLYGDQPAGWDVAGTKETILSIKREDFISYKKTHYVAQNTIICLAGNFSQKQWIKKIEKYFAKIEKGVAPQKEKVIENQKKPELILETRDIDQTHLCLGVRAFNLFHPLKYTIEVLATILGGMMSSRLFNEIRVKRGLAYYIKTEVNLDSDTGYLVTSAGIKNEKVEEAINIILKEYKRAKEKFFSEAEIKKARDYLKGKLALSMETSDNLAFFFAFQEMLEGKIKNLEEIFKEIDKVDRKKILECSREIFRPERLNLALISPQAKKEKLEGILEV
jgi:predicted Zn-dependent peptidase